MFTSQEDSPYGIIDSAVEVLVSLVRSQDLFDGVREYDRLSPCFDGVASLLPKGKQSTYLPTHVEEVDDSAEEIDLSSMFKNMRRMFNDERVPKNAFEIKPSVVNLFKDSVYGYSDKLQRRFTELYLPNLMSFDHASAALEAFMRDGLQFDEFSVDEELRIHTSALIKLDSVYRMSKELKLPKHLRDLYLRKLSVALLGDSMSRLKTNKNKAITDLLRTKRYTHSLDNPVGVVRGGHANDGQNTYPAQESRLSRARY
jgi:hypothetical protein